MRENVEVTPIRGDTKYFLPSDSGLVEVTREEYAAWHGKGDK